MAGLDRLAGLPFDPSLPLIVLMAGGEAMGSEPTVLPGRHARRTPLELLRALYPPGHALRPLPKGEARRLDGLTETDLAGDDWLVPALAPLDNLASPHGMAAISARLRAPDGCPWDRRQTHASLRPFVLEEEPVSYSVGVVAAELPLGAELAAERDAADLA